MIAEAVAGGQSERRRVQGDAASAAAAAGGGSGDVGWGTRLRQILLTGVSYMIPFVAAGGLLIALGFLFGGYEIANAPEGAQPSPRARTHSGPSSPTNTLTNLPAGGLSQYLGAVLFTLGGLAFMFLVPALAGYIAFAIADRPGLAPGFTRRRGGGVRRRRVHRRYRRRSDRRIRGAVDQQLERPQWFRGLMPVVIIPLLASLIVGLLMFLLLGRPLAAITSGLTNWLNSLTGASVIVLGIILGLMMCFDLAGPSTRRPTRSPPPG